MGKNATRGKAGKASSTGGKTASGGSGGKAPAAGSAHSLNLKNRGKDGKHSNQRSAATIKRLQMYRSDIKDINHKQDFRSGTFVTVKRKYFSKHLHSECNLTNQIACFDYEV